jgi:predicted flap endonuclease-1-like 5' DNA nuclease
MTKIIDIEGIGPAIAQKFQQAGVGSVERLLKVGGDKKGRKELVEQTGLDEDQVLKFVNMADLYRIKGVGSEYAQLLEAAGVDTVKELRNRNAENLYAKMREVNATRKMVRQLPSLTQVQGFIAHAKELTPAVTY